MKESIKKLIKASKALNDKQKSFYLALISFLPKDKLSELYAIFAKEANLTTQIKEKGEFKKSEVNKKCITETKFLFKQEEKKFMLKEEEDDKRNGDILLNQLTKI